MKIHFHRNPFKTWFELSEGLEQERYLELQYQELLEMETWIQENRAKQNIIYEIDYERLKKSAQNYLQTGILNKDSHCGDCICCCCTCSFCNAISVFKIENDIPPYSHDAANLKYIIDRVPLYNKNYDRNFSKNVLDNLKINYPDVFEWYQKYISEYFDDDQDCEEFILEKDF